MDYSDDETVLLALVEKSIKVILLEKEEWEAKSGFSFVQNTSTNGSPGRSLGKNTDSTDSLTFPTISNLRKACSSISSTNQSHRKTLIAVLEKWILQNHTKKNDTKSFGVRALTKSRGAGESTDSNPRSLLDHYVNKVITEENDKRNSFDAANTTPPTQNNQLGMGCPLFPERDLSRSLLLRCHNTLVDGEVCSSSSSPGTPWSPSMLSILRCAASLHYRLWYFRTIHKKDPKRAYGFALASSTTSGNSNKNTKVNLWISLVLLEKPCISIGRRDPLYVYTKRYELPGSGANIDNSTSDNPSASASSPSSASHILQELSKFLYLDSRSLPCPYRDAMPLDNPQEPLLREGCTIVPTITGSLVIRCQNASAVDDLLKLSQPEDNGGETIQALVESFFEVAASSPNDEEWYVKYKTPAVGQFWDNSRVAINGPRGALKKKGKKQAAQQHPPCVQRWLFLHPIDSWIGNYCSITITRSSGIAFSMAQKEHDLSWEDYCQEFGGLARSTLEFQTRCNSLVHGDINEGNLLYYHYSPKECNNKNYSKSPFPLGNRLVLIDWDEATRPKALRRKVETDEERLRYPEGLLDFPEQYTQQQLMHLFGTLAKTYYPSECQRIDDAWMRTLLFPPLSTETPALFTKYLSRSSVEHRFKVMLRNLNVATQGNSTS